jgi:alpha-tubulin suppressor-like RCC1 family protein
LAPGASVTVTVSASPIPQTVSSLSSRAVLEIDSTIGDGVLSIVDAGGSTTVSSSSGPLFSNTVQLTEQVEGCIASGLPTSLDFGSVAAGSSGQITLCEGQFRVQCSSDQSGSGFWELGAGAGACDSPCSGSSFTVSNPVTSTNGRCWSITFTPQTVGAQTGAITIEHVNTTNCPQSDSVLLTGTGVAATATDAGATTATAVAVGGLFACAVTGGGGVECWGENNEGELGNNSTTRSVVPVQVTGLTSGVTAVSAGNFSACALTVGGGVECWGNAPLATGGNVPVQVTGLTSGVTAVSVGYNFACGVTAGGGVECWGVNGSGQLGNNSISTLMTAVPVQVSGLTSGVTAVSAGEYSACAVTAGGGVECWGDNTYGELGNNSTTSSSVPVQVTGLTSGVTAVSVGTYFACAVTAGGGVECWGENNGGQLGDDSDAGPSLVPVQVTGLTSGVIAASVGGGTACVLTAGGDVECWGGSFENGSTTNSSIPVQVSGLTSGVTGVSAGEGSACALTAGGGVECWGADSAGFGVESYTPVPVSGL